MRIKRFLPTSLFWRSLMIIVLPVLLVQSVSFFVFWDRHVHSVTKNLAIHIAREANIAREVMDGGMLLDLDSFLGFDIEVKSSCTVQGALSKVSYWEDRYLYAALDETLQSHYRLASYNDKIIIHIPTHSGCLSLSFSRKKLMSRTTPLVIVWGGLSTIFFVIIALLFMRNQLRPLARLVNAADALGKGRETPRVKIAGAKEIRLLAHAFNVMKGRLHRYISQRTLMLTSISHDLRTPLTRMKLELALMEDSGRKEALNEDISHMQSMIDEFLEFTRDASKEVPKNVQIHTYLSHLIAGCRHSRLNIVSSPFPDAHVFLRTNSFKRAFENIVRNAEKYADNLHVHALCLSKAYQIFLDDDGPGISRNHRKNVFKPFFRIESSRNQETGGLGLGLSIVKDIVHAHGGRVRLQRSPMNGLRVILSVPL